MKDVPVALTNGHSFHSSRSTRSLRRRTRRNEALSCSRRLRSAPNLRRSKKGRGERVLSGRGWRQRIAFGLSGLAEVCSKVEWIPFVARDMKVRLLIHFSMVPMNVFAVREYHWTPADGSHVGTERSCSFARCRHMHCYRFYRLALHGSGISNLLAFILVGRCWRIPPS